MEQLRSLPFKVGDRVETKSFVPGYRGAWFRCVIKATGKKGVEVDLYDYTEEKPRCMKLYHKVPSKSRKVELMLRPQFPPVYSEGEAPDLNTLSEVIVVTNGVWKVGDLVDWFCDGAYWSGSITKFLGDDKIQLQSPPKPMGEDMVYDEALCEDLRPSLEWSRKSGWKVPVPKGNNSNSPCARLIEPVNQEKDTEAAAAKEPPPSELKASASRASEKGTGNETAVAPQEERREQGGKKVGDAKGSCSDSVSSTFWKEQPPENSEATERIKLNKIIPLNSSTCDSIESLIVDMEELLNRVKWMKRILELRDSGNAGWKFQEYRAGGNKTGHD